MSKDIGLFLINNCFDLKLEGNDLAGDGGLETAVAISLFTDARATDDELPDLKIRKRGWWGDAINEIFQDQIGSKIWLLERGKRTLQDLNKLENYARQSLQWMLQDGVAASVEVSGQFEQGQTILNVSIVKPNEEETRYSVLWDAQEVRRL